MEHDNSRCDGGSVKWLRNTKRWFDCYTRERDPRDPMRWLHSLNYKVSFLNTFDRLIKAFILRAIDFRLRTVITTKSELESSFQDLTHNGHRCSYQYTWLHGIPDVLPQRKLGMRTEGIISPCVVTVPRTIPRTVSVLQVLTCLRVVAIGCFRFLFHTNQNVGCWI